MRAAEFGIRVKHVRYSSVIHLSSCVHSARNNQPTYVSQCLGLIMQETLYVCARIDTGNSESASPIT